MVHQKYKLKFFHYQGLSFIFLHKVHVEAEMQELRLPLPWKQCYTSPCQRESLLLDVARIFRPHSSSIVRAGVAGWSGRDPCGRPPRFASSIIHMFDQKG